MVLGGIREAGSRGGVEGRARETEGNITWLVASLPGPVRERNTLPSGGSIARKWTSEQQQQNEAPIPVVLSAANSCNAFSQLPSMCPVDAFPLTLKIS